MLSQRKRLIIATVAACVGLSLLGGLPDSRDNAADGWLFDTALWARSLLFPSNGHGNGNDETDNVIVVALDQASLAAPELSSLPRALFSPVWARTLDGLAQAGASVVAFDFLLSYSGGQFKPGYDRDFQRALNRHRDKVVLGRSATTLPAKSYLAALRFEPGALGLLELLPDRDGVTRHFPLAFESGDGNGDGEAARSLAAAALTKVGLGPLPRAVVPAPRRHPEAITAYALADLLRCFRTAPEAMGPILKNRLVFIGSVLADEDRRLGAARYLAPAAARNSALTACDLPRLGASATASRTVPGVFLHAMTAQAIISGDWVAPLPVRPRVAISALAGGVGALLGLLLAPWSAFILALVLAGILWGGEVAALEMGLWLPAMVPIMALFLSTVLAYLVRYLVEERKRRSIQHAFGHYVAPSVVEGLLESPEGLRLGGTIRDASVMFADLSGFTALSTRTEPAELVALTNHYLAIIADEVDASGGYVDKFIGDAVMAIWGAPAPSEHHALAAARAALRIVDKVAEAGRAAEARGEPSFGIKIGIHSGKAIVGNVGSAKRYNYTAVGETVNIAARLEGLPGVYGCSLLLGPSTAAAVKDQVLLREIDRVAVKGRTEPLTIHEPLANKTGATPGHQTAAVTFAKALGHYRARRFDQAAEIWRGMADDDGPARIMAARALAYAAAPPPEDWDGVFVMSGK